MSNPAHDKTLILLRHAEAEAGLGKPDHDRELTTRGRDGAHAAGTWLREHDCVPELVLCSTAVRARQTWHAALEGGLSTEFIQYRKAVYQGGADLVLSTIRDEAGDVGTVLVVGHNPTMMHLASMLCDGRGSTDAHDLLARGFAPGGAAVLRFSGGWRSLDEDGATLERFHVVTADTH